MGNRKILDARAKKRVVKALLNAFADTAPPEWDKMVYPEGLHYDDVLDLRDRLCGMDWRQMGSISDSVERHRDRPTGMHWRQIGRNSDSVERHRNDEFSFLTTCAMRYYLPGYLLACLKDPFAADELMDRVVDMLSQCTQGRSVRTVESGRHDLAEMISSMTPAQTHAVAMFVVFVFQNHPEYSENADESLEYWQKVERASR